MKKDNDIQRTKLKKGNLYRIKVTKMYEALRKLAGLYPSRARLAVANLSNFTDHYIHNLISCRPIMGIL